jgi:hypothetical protein
MAAFDGPDRLEPAQGGFGGSQGSEALAVTKEPFHGGVVALDQVVSPFPVDVTDVVEMRIIAVVDLADNAPVGVRLVGANCYRPVEPHALDRLVKEGLRGLHIASRGQPEVDHLPVGIDRAPEVAPLAADADIRLVNMPIDAGPAQMFLGSLCQFGPKLLDPAIDRRSIDGNAALGQQSYIVATNSS